MKEEFSPEGITGLFEQASRLIHGARFSGGLTPAQWTALRYFAEAPPFSRTMASLARFQGLTLAPITRTVRTLMEKGLVDRHPNPRSKRADLIIVNKAGRQMLNQNPRAQIAEVIAKVPIENREVLVQSMRTILDGLLELGLPQFDESLLADDDE
ncbi:MAG: MarR family transcriptional regulator [Rhodospirillaceae bacterium]